MQDAQLGPDVVVGSALARWCKESFPGLPRSGIQVDAQLRHDPAVGAFVEFVKGQSLLEATYWLSSAYAQLAGEERRKQLAMFFTPPSLTSRLLDDLSTSGVDFAVRKFCDPACGGAAFLAPIATRMRDALRERGERPSPRSTGVSAVWSTTCSVTSSDLTRMPPYARCQSISC